MAKMTYRDFDTRVQQTFSTAQTLLRTDGDISPVLLGVDSAGRASMNVLSTFSAPHEQEVAKSAAAGVTLLHGPLRDHTRALREQVTETRAVALLSVGLGWMLLGRNAADAVAQDIAASDHPGRAEHLIVAGVWPREFYAAMHTAVVLRDDEGLPRAAESFRFDRDSAGGPVLERVTSWMVDILPPAPRR